MNFLFATLHIKQKGSPEINPDEHSKNGV